MADDPGTEEQPETETETDKDGRAAGDARSDSARKKIKDLEEDPPKNLSDWPDDEAKYVTFGGEETDKSWEEGPTSKLGPSGVEYQEDGSVEVDGEKVDNPEDFKGDPIPIASETEREKKRRGEGDGEDSGSNPERPETGSTPGE